LVVRRTSALVEAGILAAIAVLFTIVSNYIPVLSFIANVIWPLPIILCGRRNGLKWSILSLIVAGIIVAMLLSPVMAITEVLILGIVGLAMGEAMRRQMSPAQVLSVGTLATLVSLALSIAAGFYLLDINVFKQLTEAVEQSMSLSTDIYNKIGLPASQMEIVQTQMANTMKALKMLLPAAFFLSAPITVFINYWVATKVLARMGDYFPPFPPFSQWKLPKSLLVPLAVALALMFFYKGQPESMTFKAAVNVMFVISFFFMIDALSVVKWYVQDRGKASMWFKLAVFLTFFNQFFAQIMIMAGIYDLMFDFRKRFSRKE